MKNITAQALLQQYQIELDQYFSKYADATVALNTWLSAHFSRAQLCGLLAALLKDETPDLSAHNMLQSIRQRLSQNNEEDQKSLIILQQLSLMMSILQQLSRLKQSLSHEHDQDATELASL